MEQNAQASVTFEQSVNTLTDETTIYGSGFTVDEVFGDMPELDWFSMNDDYYYGVQATHRDPGYKIYYGKSLADLQNRDEKEAFGDWEWNESHLDTFSLVDLLFNSQYFSNPNECHRTIRQYEEDYTNLPQNESIKNIYEFEHRANNSYLYVYDSCSVFVYKNQNGLQNTVIPIGESEITEPIRVESQKEHSKIHQIN